MRRVLTGIKPTGSPHLGNWLGAIAPAIARSRQPEVESYYFLADYHALTGGASPDEVARSSLEIAATWVALGLEPARVTFYRQSDVPEVLELCWLLTCIASKGLLNRAHAYKAAVDANLKAGEEPDAGIRLGLYLYPVLMAADILLFDAHEVPVGRDQVQHIEIARDLAARFNLEYREDCFTLPEALVEPERAVLPGLDGRKMSKSYDNTLPLWDDPATRRARIAGIVTDARLPGEPKDPEASTLYQIHAALLDQAGRQALADAYRAGIAWGEAKSRLHEDLEARLAEPRRRYQELIADPRPLAAWLSDGAAQARDRARPLLARLRRAVGLRVLSAPVQPSPPPVSDPREGPSTRARRKAGKRARIVRFVRGGQAFGRLLAGDGGLLAEGPWPACEGVPMALADAEGFSIGEPPARWQLSSGIRPELAVLAWQEATEALPAG